MKNSSEGKGRAGGRKKKRGYLSIDELEALLATIGWGVTQCWHNGPPGGPTVDAARRGVFVTYEPEIGNENIDHRYLLTIPTEYGNKLDGVA